MNLRLTSLLARLTAALAVSGLPLAVAPALVVQFEPQALARADTAAPSPLAAADALAAEIQAQGQPEQAAVAPRGVVFSAAGLGTGSGLGLGAGDEGLAALTGDEGLNGAGAVSVGTHSPLRRGPGAYPNTARVATGDGAPPSNGGGWAFSGLEAAFVSTAATDVASSASFFDDAAAVAYARDALAQASPAVVAWASTAAGSVNSPYTAPTGAAAAAFAPIGQAGPYAAAWAGAQAQASGPADLNSAIVNAVFGPDRPATVAPDAGRATDTLSSAPTGVPEPSGLALTALALLCALVAQPRRQFCPRGV